jgi:hypothetical protein
VRCSPPFCPSSKLTDANSLCIDSYEQALHSANQARKLAAAANFPFSRPNDFFAEMVKSDAHMERIRVRLLSESSALKRAEEKRKEREAKKFGKQVQIEKLKEREKNKKEMVERVKDVKRSTCPSLFLFSFSLDETGWLMVLA